MRLIRLLSVSRAFTAGEIPMGRYQQVARRSMPVFRGAATRLGNAVTGDGLVRKSSDPVPARGERALAADEGMLRRAGRWWARILRGVSGRGNPFAGGRSMRPVVPRVGGAVKDVRVVRNDLSDTDFEVLRPGRRGGARKLAVPEATELPVAMSLDFQAPGVTEVEERRVKAVGRP